MSVWTHNILKHVDLIVKRLYLAELLPFQVFTLRVIDSVLIASTLHGKENCTMQLILNKGCQSARLAFLKMQAIWEMRFEISTKGLVLCDEISWL